jgi:hypothetical protein
VAADVVIARSTAFDDSTMRKLARRAELLKPGAVVATFSQPLPDSKHAFDVLETRKCATSFGTVTLYIHRRRRFVLRCVLVGGRR